MENYLKKFGFFGGTFDPIHYGHINLAIYMKEIFELDRIFFCPANYSPGKKETQPVAAKEHRKIMTEMAIEDFRDFSLLEMELSREGPSYTIDTIRELKKQYIDAEIHLILGEDVLDGLAKWKEVETLLELAPPLVGTRMLYSLPTMPVKLTEMVKEGQVPIPIMEISSTMVRERMALERYCKHILPPKVFDYIVANRLY